MPVVIPRPRAAPPAVGLIERGARDTLRETDSEELPMFAGKTMLQILSMGGFTMYVLLFCSVLSLAVIIDRLAEYAIKGRTRRGEFMERIREALKNRNLGSAIASCEGCKAPFAMVVLSGLKRAGREERHVSGVMERQIAVETTKLERLTSIVGTIGNTAVYIGLFGTVLGVIRAFRDISISGAGGMDVVIGGVSEALITTAAGLAVAVPAVIFYNYFIKRIERFVNDMELCASETSDLISKKDA
jgi:biopolymer transport protein ExbB